MNIDRVDIDTHLAEDRPVAFFPGVVVVLAVVLWGESGGAVDAAAREPWEIKVAYIRHAVLTHCFLLRDHATLFDVRLPPPLLTVPVTLF